MSAHSRLTSLDFKYNDAISSISCTMSDSSASPVFESQSSRAEHEHPKRISFDSTGVKQVRFICGSMSHDCVQLLYFLDSDRKTIASYDPYQIGLAGAQKEVELRETEELIGIYGVSCKCDWLSSLGFLTKARMGKNNSTN